MFRLEQKHGRGRARDLDSMDGGKCCATVSVRREAALTSSNRNSASHTGQRVLLTVPDEALRPVVEAVTDASVSTRCVGRSHARMTRTKSAPRTEH